MSWTSNWLQSILDDADRRTTHGAPWPQREQQLDSDSRQSTAPAEADSRSREPHLAAERGCEQCKAERRDAKVREKHRPLHGVVFSVRTGINGLFPGQEVNCRCTAIPKSLYDRSK